MRCLIAELITEVPAAGGLASRCKDYLHNGEETPQILIDEAKYRPERYPGYGEDTISYMESAYQFYMELLNFGGFYLHASAVLLDGKVYLFSGNSTVGKSTHTRLWQKEFGDRAVVINDDKPALRRINGVWYAYGTPWCGKDGINQNQKGEIAGVCFMKKADHNAIRRLSTFEAMQRVLSQTIHKFKDAEDLDKMLANMELFLQEIPAFELENRPEPEAVRLSYQTMSGNLQEDKT